MRNTATLQQRRRIAVYGTLRPGHGNSALWRHRADALHDGFVRIPGFRLVTHGGFPYAIPASEQIVAALIEPLEDHYGEVLSDMDRLEGVRHDHYRRIPVLAQTPDGWELVWLYIAFDPAEVAELHRVPNNDWNDWRRPAA